MKKTILISLFALASICGYSQTFDYELKALQKVGAYYPTPGDTANYFSQIVSITVGIVGEKYGFVPPSGKPNSFVAKYPRKVAQSPDYIDQLIKEQAVLFVEQSYPSK